VDKPSGVSRRDSLRKQNEQDIFDRVKRKAWAFGYNESQLMLVVGQVMLCKLYDEQYAGNFIFTKIKELLGADQVIGEQHNVRQIRKDWQGGKREEIEKEIQTLTSFNIWKRASPSPDAVERIKEQVKAALSKSSETFDYESLMKRIRNKKSQRPIISKEIDESGLYLELDRDKDCGISEEDWKTAGGDKESLQKLRRLIIKFQDEKRSLSEPPRDMVEDWKKSGVGALDEKIFLGWSDDDNWGNDEGLNEEDLRVGFSHEDLTSCLDGLLRYGQGVPNQGFTSRDPRNYIIYNIWQLLSSFWPVICHRLFDEAIPDQMRNISDVPPDVLLLICDYLIENPIGQTGYVNHKRKYQSTKQLPLGKSYALATSGEKNYDLDRIAYLQRNILDPQKDSVLYYPFQEAAMNAILFSDKLTEAGEDVYPASRGKNVVIKTSVSSQYDGIVSLISVLISGVSGEIQIGNFVVRPSAKKLVDIISVLDEDIDSRILITKRHRKNSELVNASVFDPIHFFNECLTLTTYEQVGVTGTSDPPTFLPQDIQEQEQIDVLDKFLRVGKKFAITVTPSLLTSQEEGTRTDFRNKIIKKCVVKAIFWFHRNYFSPVTAVPPIVLLLEKRDSRPPPPIFVGISKYGKNLTWEQTTLQKIADRMGDDPHGWTDVKELLSNFEKFSQNKLKVETDSGFTITEEQLIENSDVFDYRPSRKHLDKQEGVKLKEIVEIIPGKKVTNLKEEGDVPYITIRDYLNRGDFADKERLRLVKPEKNLVHVRFDDILFSNTGTIGKKAIVRRSFKHIEGAIISPQIFVLRVKSNQVNPYFLYYLLKQSRDVRFQVHNATRGQTIRHLSRDDLENIVVVLPDLKTQEKKVRAIEELEEKRIHLENQIDEIREKIDSIASAEVKV